VPQLPAMVALVEHGERGPVGVHCTYLRSNGSKADTQQPKAMFGPVRGAAVRFGAPQAGELAISERPWARIDHHGLL
jgi:hypothetical protein